MERSALTEERQAGLRQLVDWQREQCRREQVGVNKIVASDGLDHNNRTNRLTIHTVAGVTLFNETVRNRRSEDY